MPTPLRTVLLLVVCLISFGLAETQDVFLSSRPEVSPDGKTILFSWKGDIYSASIDGGAITAISEHPATEYGASFSPDGSKIAFSSSRTGVNQVYTIDINGGAAEQLTFHTSGSSIEQWCDDSTLIVSGTRDYFWRKGSRFFKIDTEPSFEEGLIFDGYGRTCQLSPDGKKLLFVREGPHWYRQGYQGSQNGQIWLYDLETKEYSLLLGHDGDYDYPSWGHNSNIIYYSASNDSSPKNLWEYNLDTKVQRQLTNFSDGSVITVSAARAAPVVVFRKLFDLYKINPEDGSAPEKIELILPENDVPDHIVNLMSSSASDSCFVSDGLEIAFVSERDIWVMDTELREPVRVCNTPKKIEKNLIFSEDGKTLYFLSDNGISSDIYTAKPSDPNNYWWQNDSFAITPITDSNENITDFTISPNKKYIAYQIAGQGLWLCDIDGANSRKLINAWANIEYDWSPQSQYIAYSTEDDDIRRNIMIIAVDGNAEPYNVSRNPRDDGLPKWSPDGKYLAWIGSSFGDEVDAFYVPLQIEVADKTDRDRKLEKAIKLMEDKRKKDNKKEEKNTKVKKVEEAKDVVDEDEIDTKDDEKSESVESDKKDEDVKEDKEPVKGDSIDFEGLYKRVQRINTPGITESAPLWIADNKLLFNQRQGTGTSSYTVEFPDDLKAKKYSNTRIPESALWLKKAKKIAMGSGGTPALLDKNDLKKYAFTVKTELDRKDWYELGFKVAWRYMRDGFYSSKILKNVNWDSMLDKYLDKAINSPDNSTFGRVVNLMLGELNASHLGFYPKSDGNWSSKDKWKPQTGHLGVRIDNQYEGDGLRIRDILPDSPAEREQSRLYAGEIITHIDGVAVNNMTEYYTQLTGSLERDILLTVNDKNGTEREVTIRPYSYSQIYPLLKQHWIDECRSTVNAKSNGELGYVYIPRMMWDEFLQFEKEIFAEGSDKDGMIIDVRGNGGGFTTDHILTVLCQPAHAYVTPRGGTGKGYTYYRRVYNTWDKPIVVLCDQDSFSNAEIFSHSIKTLKRGKLVGVPTAGGVISTGSREVIDLGSIRMPFIGWYPLSSGKDMELNGAIPDYVIWPKPGDAPAGLDVQLNKAVEVLAEQVEIAKRTNYGKAKPVFLIEDSEKQ